jgi:ATP-dependent helicase HrpA
VGYKIRFRSQVSKATVITYMTDGVLLAQTQGDRHLRAYDTILVDEAHERSLNIDFLLGILQRLLLTRPELKLIITSATLDTAKFAARFPAAPVIEVPGRTYPVDVVYPAEPADAEDADEVGHIERAVEAVLTVRRQDRSGDMLVFMPTERDIRESKELLEARCRLPGGREADTPLILPLFGRLSRQEQQRIFMPAKRQKIVLATNIAETSLTVPGIRYVVDSGLARLTMYNPRARTTKMPVVPISRASADQRKGRCGRMGPGICIRLYSEADYAGRPEFTTPEILRSNLAEVILRMLSLGLGAPGDFPFLDPPSSRAIKDGYALLAELGAIDSQGDLTRRGRIMARLPLDPRIARMILAAQEENALREVVVIAAALSVQDPRIRLTGKEGEADAAHARFADQASDFLGFWNLWQEYHRVLAVTGGRSRARKFCTANFLSHQRMREWEDIHDQISSILAEEKGFAANEQPATADAIHRAILSGNLRFIALKKAKNLYQGGQGGEIMIFPGSAQFNRAGQWIMAAELVETSRLFARTVATIKPEWLEPLAGSLCRSTYSSPHWEKRRGQVVALERVTLFGLVIVASRRVNFGPIKPAEARAIFIQQALVAGELPGTFPFLDHNLALVARLHEMEERLRQRDILVDEASLFQFYDERLPAGVWDQAGLVRETRQHPAANFLRMNEEDVVQCLPADRRLAQFPVSLAMGGLTLPLSYAFEPTSEEDGVSVHILAEQLVELRPELFEWLVPGLLEEKVLFLLRGLPKPVRKQLVPLPQTAAAILEDLHPGEGSLYQALETALQRRRGVRLDPKLWTAIELPNHLRMRYCLVHGSSGTPSRCSRVFADLLEGKSSAKAPAASLLETKKHWERQGITEWDFALLPVEIPLPDAHGKAMGRCFPALVSNGQGGVAIELCLSKAEQQAKTRHGLALLYSLQFKSQWAQARKDFSFRKLPWQLWEGLGVREELDAQLEAMLLREVFPVRSGTIPDQATFQAEVARVRAAGFYPLVKAVMDQVLVALRARRQTMDLLARFEKKGGGGQLNPGFTALIEDILPKTFLTSFDQQQLKAAPRYLEALRIRIERAILSPAKDAAKEDLLGPHVLRLARCRALSAPSVELAGLIAAYQQAVAEYRISLFAQEMKTLFPVSAKRLAKQWCDLERAMVFEGGSPEKK